MMKPQEKSLGELLRQAGKITHRQIQVALGEQKKSHEPIGKVLVRLGFVEERDILQVMQGMMVLTFRVGTEWYGIETFRVREVLKYAPFGPWAKNGESWDGEFTLRGQKLPLLSFRKYLGQEILPDPKGTWFIVLEKKGQNFILWVDRVREVARLKIEQIEPVPPYLFGKKNDLYYCLGRIKEELYSILNPDKLVENGGFTPLAGKVMEADALPLPEESDEDLPKHAQVLGPEDK
jgi:chemotaxis signal transduction protein